MSCTSCGNGSDSSSLSTMTYGGSVGCATTNVNSTCCSSGPCQSGSSALILTAQSVGTSVPPVQSSGVPAGVLTIIGTVAPGMTVLYDNLNGFGNFDGITFTALRAGYFKICGGVNYAFQPSLPFSYQAKTVILINGIISGTSTNNAAVGATTSNAGQTCVTTYMTAGSTANLAGYFVNYTGNPTFPAQVVSEGISGTYMNVSFVSVENKCK